MEQQELPLTWRAWLASFSDPGQNAKRRTVVARSFAEAVALANTYTATDDELGELVKVEIGVGRGAAILPDLAELADERHRATDQRDATH